MANGYNLPSRTLVSQSDNAMVPTQRIPRSKFKNTWNRKTSFNTGTLIPFLCQEMLPGDHVQYDVSIYARMSTFVQPMMDQQRLDTHFFFVPNRLVWSNWKKLMGEKATVASSIAYTVPQINLGVAGPPVGSLADHLGIPTTGQIGGAFNPSVNALPFRMYNLIWNEWFKAESLQDDIATATNDGPDSITDYALQSRNKSHDYFTTCLPSPQNTSTGTGVTAGGALVGLQGIAPITGIGSLNQTFTAGPSATVYESPATSTNYAFYKGPIDATGANNQIIVAGNAATGYPQIYALLDNVPGFSINALRQAWAIQQLLELDNRSGTRYIEIIKSQFGVEVPDYRLQRPEYIGGGQSPLNITPIAQTSQTASTPLGSLAATGTIAGSHRASYACQEHGYVIAVLSIKTELSYQQGIHKHWTRNNRYSFYTPAFADLSDQTVFGREIYFTGDAGTNDFYVFGYQERWQEYRTCYSDITGLMRSTAAGTIDIWHLAQRFLSMPILGNAFIQDQPPITRVLAAGILANQQQYVADINYVRNITRPMPTFSVPATLGRF